MAEDAIQSSSEPAGLVVAVVGSAASTGSLERFLSRLDLRDGVAVVVVLQNREALDVSRFKAAVAVTGRELQPVRPDAPITAGSIYLPEPDVIVGTRDGRFETRPAEEKPGERGTIDSFLVSLAQVDDAHPVAVLLDGTGDDGTLGVRAVKEAGGLALAEATEHHLDGSLATSSSPAAIADFLLPPEQLADRVNRYAQQVADHKQEEIEKASKSDIGTALASIATILRQRTGHDFHGYKRGTFLRRVHRRMQVTQAETLRGYVETLRSRADEPTNLFNDLLIGVTQFFRDDKEFELLEREVVPKLFEGKGPGDPVRVWIIGCSTGEEAYSIAILLREHMATLDEVPQVQIFASDLDGRALASARVGRFAASIANDISPERLARWFVKEGNTYCVAKELREMCIFSQHSVIKDAPFSRLDLVSCRNLLIYLDPDLQNRVIPLFHFALRPGGYLFLGNSENASRHGALFAPIEQRSRILVRQDTVHRTIPDFPFTAVERRTGPLAEASRPRSMEEGFARRAERIAERHAPGYVIVDEAFDILHFSGRTGRFLDQAGGAASLNLLSLVHPDLRMDLRAALARAAEEKSPVQINALLMRLDGHHLMVDLVVEPVRNNSDVLQGFVVLFREGPLVDAAAGSGGLASAPVESEHIQRLESDLRSIKDRLQSTIEELESTNEELKSSNEEYQSLNEELQSANEELETSKEELQSVNEELTTVNGELAHRVQELARSNSDLKNFLESTQIGTIFLDNELRVMNYTPAVTELFHMVESDIGRPIGHIKSRVAYDELQEDVQRVLRTLGSVDRKLHDSATGTRYMARVLPYRSIDNFIGGVVITFTDVTPLTDAQRALSESEGHAKFLLTELQHRVRNMLAVIRSIVRRTAETSDSVEDFAMHLDGRLDAFARVEAAVTRDPGAGLDMEMLIAETLRAHAAHEGEKVKRIEGPKVRLQPKAAEILALVFHELATNAVKYGALSGRHGHVEVNWHTEAEAGPRLVIQWVETGVTLSERSPRRRGFGSELIERTLAYDLGGGATLSFEPDGLHCTIALPVGAGILNVLPDPRGADGAAG